MIGCCGYSSSTLVIYSSGIRTTSMAVPIVVGLGEENGVWFGEDGVLWIDVDDISVGA